jgi:hypothetical protein
MDQPFAVAEVVGVVPDVITDVADTSQLAAGLLPAWMGAGPEASPHFVPVPVPVPVPDPAIRRHPRD